SDRLERSDPLLVSAFAWGISFLIAGLTCDLATQAVSMLAEFIRSSLLLFRLSEALSIFRWLEIPGLWMLLTGAQLRRKSSRILWVRVLIVAIALRETRVFETLLAWGLRGDVGAFTVSIVLAWLMTALMHVL